MINRVLDSYSLIAYLEGEKGREKVISGKAQSLPARELLTMIPGINLKLIRRLY